MRSKEENSFWIFTLIISLSSTLLQASANSFQSVLHDNKGSNVNSDKLIIHDGVAFVGGTNYIIKLALTRSPDQAADVTMIRFPSSENSFTTCTEFSVDVPCNNTVRILEVMHDGTLLACGTNAGRPKCSYFNVTDFSSKHADLDARNWLSEYPDGSATSLLLRNGSTSSELYVGAAKSTSAVFCKKTPKLLKSDRAWLRDPEFIATYSLHDNHSMIYVFFNEKSSNFIQDNFVGGNKKSDFYSMVARVCSNDQGGSYEETKWMTFNKVRLICPWPGNDLENHESLFYDEMVSVHHTEKTVYGIFRHNRHWKMNSYAICRFSTDTIDATIGGTLFPDKMTKYADKNNNNNAIEFSSSTVPPFSPGMCPQSSNYTLPSTFEVFVTSHTLVRMNVLPEGKKPFLVERDEENFRFIFSQQYPLFDILFLLSDIGTLKKIKVHPDLSTEVLFSQPSNIGGDAIISAKLVKEMDIILAITGSKIISFPTHLCSAHTNCSSCHSDPGCVWKYDSKDLTFSCSHSKVEQQALCSEVPSIPDNLAVIVTEERRDVMWDVDELTSLSYLVKVERESTNKIVFKKMVKEGHIYIPCVNLTKGARYKVGVSAINGTSIGKEAVASFTTEFPSPEVQYLSPANGIVTVSWKKISEAVTYTLRLSDQQGNFAQEVTISNVGFNLEQTLKIKSGKGYRVNVTAISSDGVESSMEIPIRLENISSSATNGSAITVLIAIFCGLFLLTLGLLVHNNIWIIKPGIQFLTSETHGCSYNRRYWLIWREAKSHNNMNGVLKDDETESTRA